jgi:hypothetical protein
MDLMFRSSGAADVMGPGVWNMKASCVMSAAVRVPLLALADTVS